MGLCMQADEAGQAAAVVDEGLVEHLGLPAEACEALHAPALLLTSRQTSWPYHPAAAIYMSPRICESCKGIQVLVQHASRGLCKAHADCAGFIPMQVLMRGPNVADPRATLRPSASPTAQWHSPRQAHA